MRGTRSRLNAVAFFATSASHRVELRRGLKEAGHGDAFTKEGDFVGGGGVDLGHDVGARP